MAAGDAGPALILVFVLNGLIALVVGCCYAELYPTAFGPFAASLFNSATGNYVSSWLSSTIAVIALLSFLCINYPRAAKTSRRVELRL